jgi:L-asparaginase
MSIRIITTGGTIDKIYFDRSSSFQVGDPQISQVLREANVTSTYTMQSVLRKDSLDMTDADRQLIRQVVASCPEARVLITHGTDTMIATACALGGIPGKVIVLTGAMAPARFHETDAVFNIGFAFAAVQTLPPGVYVAINGQVFDPAHVRKNVQEHRFEAAD